MITPEEMNDPSKNPKEGLFSHTHDFVKLTEVARKYPTIHEIKVDSEEHYNALIELIKRDDDIVPLFIKDNTGYMDIIPATPKDVIFKGNDYLVYLGKKIKTLEQKNDKELM